MAAGRADDLHDAVVEAIDSGQVPQAFRDDLLSRSNELVNEVNCPPPPTETNEDEQRGKGHKKKDKQGESAPPVDTTVTTVTTVTDIVPTDTTNG